MVALKLFTKRELVQPMTSPLATARAGYRAKLRVWLAARVHAHESAEAAETELKAKAEMVAAETAYIAQFRLLPEIRKLIEIAPEPAPKS
jgi:hypothetical protein